MVRAMMAGIAPIFCSIARRIASIARLGMVCRMPTPPVNGPRSHQIRAAQIPRGIPTRIAIPVETPVSIRCSPVRNQSSGSRSETNAIHEFPAITASPRKSPVAGLVWRKARVQNSWPDSAEFLLLSRSARDNRRVALQFDLQG